MTARPGGRWRFGPGTTHPRWRSRSGSTPTSRPTPLPPGPSSRPLGRAGARSRSTAIPTARPRRCERRSRPTTGVEPTGVLCQRLERGHPVPSPRLRGAGQARHDVRAHLCAALPHRPAHHHCGGDGPPRRGVQGKSRRGSPHRKGSRRGLRKGRPRQSASFVRPTTPPAGRSRPRASGRYLPWSPGSSSWTRPTASSPRGPPSSCVARRPRPRRDPHLLQDLGHGRVRVSATLVARPGGRGFAVRIGGAPLPPRRPRSRPPAVSPWDSATRCEARVATIVEERGRVAAGPGRPRRSRSGPPTPISSCSVPARRTASAVWKALLDHSVLIRDISDWPGPRGLPAGHHRHARRERPFPRSLGRGALGPFLTREAGKGRRQVLLSRSGPGCSRGSSGRRARRTASRSGATSICSPARSSPMRKKAHRSDTRAACCMLWVTMMIVTRDLSSPMSSSMSRVEIGSSDEVGSSIKSTSGSTASARAMHKRCCSPPDSVEAWALAGPRQSPTRRRR